MSDELQNPVIKDDDSDMADLMKAAELHDLGEEVPPELLGKTPEPEPAAEEIKPTEIKPEIVGDRPRGPDGKFIKAEGETEPVAAVSESVDASKTAPETDYARLQREKKEKETARLDKTWENVNARKEAIERKEREIIERERRISQPQRQDLQVPTMEDGTPITSQALFGAREDYKKRAREALAQGDYDTHREQDNLADEAEKAYVKVKRIEQQMAQEAQMQQWSHSQQLHVNEMIKNKPDLADASTPLRKEVDAILSKIGDHLWLLPRGLEMAVEHAEKILDAREATSLREENKALKAEKERLTGLTSISGSSPTSAPVTKTFEQMDDKEQDAWLLRKAREVDAKRAY